MGNIPTIRLSHTPAALPVKEGIADTSWTFLQAQQASEAGLGHKACAHRQSWLHTREPKPCDCH